MAGNFTMSAAREAAAGGIGHIEAQIDALEAAIDNNAGLVFDLAKTIVESVCKALLTDAGKPFGPNDDLPQLFRTAALSLPLLPDDAANAAGARKGFAQTLRALSGSVQGICEMRNSCGFASHGSDVPRPMLGPAHALFAASAADAIVGLLFRASTFAAAPRRLAYNDNPAFNAEIDSSQEPVRVLDEEFAPSLVLFTLAPEPYRFALGEFVPEPDEALDGGAEVAA